jgi:D-glycero-alpha-D-manno-heptose 1-phosphate guanylyltransferase
MNGLTAAILAGGLGTRLRSVVADRPKVLAEVAGRPFLAHLLEQLAAAGVCETVLLVGYGADQVCDTFGTRFGEMRLMYSVEHTPLGTAGALRNALNQFARQDVLLLNGDSFCDVNLGALVQAHRNWRDAEVSLSLARVDNASRFGRVRVGRDRRVLRFEEKIPVATGGWINAGVYLMRREVVEGIPAGVPSSLERDVFPHLVGQGKVRGFRGGRFIDIGVPDSYARADAFFGAGCADAR